MWPTAMLDITINSIKTAKQIKVSYTDLGGPKNHVFGGGLYS